MSDLGPHFLNWQVQDAALRFAAAPPDTKWQRAQRLVQAKFDRGDYPELQDLDEATRDALAKQLMDGGTPCS